MEGLPYDGADGAVRAGADVEDDRLEFIQVDVAVGEDLFIGLHGNDFADEDARFVVPALHFTFQSDRIFFDDRRIDVRRLVDMDAGLLNLVDFVARFHAEVVGNDDRILGGESNGEGLGLLHVVRRLVLR